MKYFFPPVKRLSGIPQMSWSFIMAGKTLCGSYFTRAYILVKYLRTLSLLFVPCEFFCQSGRHKLILRFCYCHQLNFCCSLMGNDYAESFEITCSIFPLLHDTFLFTDIVIKVIEARFPLLYEKVHHKIIKTSQSKRK